MCSGPIHLLGTRWAALGQALAGVREQGKCVHVVIQAAVDTGLCLHLGFKRRELKRKNDTDSRKRASGQSLLGGR